MAPLARGVAIENALGRNLPSNFPVIDRFTNGIATSIKSLDLGAKSYQQIASLTNKVRGYIETVAGFGGRTWGGTTVRGADITGRALELAVPAGGTAEQMAALNGLIGYAQQVGVTLTIVVH
jgi:filamentous hemagglutinin